ncbi:hypothetical protein AA313_de0204093 [Arthrobotrys entomopaga]|nr:hypothetical protein AA313_de0204093 [Arthrobotrys entomopaga]
MCDHRIPTSNIDFRWTGTKPIFCLPIASTMWKFSQSRYLALSLALLVGRRCRAQTSTTSDLNLLYIAPSPSVTAIVFPTACSQIHIPQRNQPPGDANYYFAYFCGNENTPYFPNDDYRQCCVANYYDNYDESSIRFDDWDLLFVQTVCPYGSDAPLVPYSTIGGELLNYCCPR